MSTKAIRTVATPQSQPAASSGAPAWHTMRVLVLLFGMVCLEGHVSLRLPAYLFIIAAMPHHKLSVDVHGKTVTYEGVPLHLVREKAGMVFDDSMHSKKLTSYLLVEAADSYRVVFALPELDPAFTERVILLVDRADGHSTTKRVYFASASLARSA